MEQNLGYFKKAKTWNIVALVLKIIATIGGITTIPGLVDPSVSVKQFEKSAEILNNEAFTATIQQSIELVQNPIYRIVGIVTFLGNIALVVLFIMAARQLKQQQITSKVAYYLALGLAVLSLIGTLLTGSFSIAGVVMTVITSLPAILVLVYLFKLDSDDE